MGQQTPFNHGGRSRHAGTDACDALKELKRRVAALDAAFCKLSPYQPGEANRLNDYARDVQGVAHNLVRFLEHAGPSQVAA